MSEPYRPSNGTEGDWFTTKFCFQCSRGHLDDDEEGEPCPILGRTYAYDVDHAECPEEWVDDEHGPRCTAFTVAEEEERYRCEATPDLFAKAKP